MARRIRTSRFRLASLLDVMEVDKLSVPEKIVQLRRELSEHYQQPRFLKCKSMGSIMKVSLETLLDNYTS